MTTAAAPRKTEKPRSRSGPLNLLEGFKDRLPGDIPYWDHILDRIHRMVRDYGYMRMETPVIEDARLFSVLKDDSPVFREELMTFEHAELGLLALRPENTLGVARAYRQHAFHLQPKPLKLYYIAPQFRWEKPAAGRYRQFTQFGIEVFGEDQPVLDAQVIAAYYFLLQELQIDVRLHLNSMGHDECRAQYAKLLTDYYKTKKGELCEACRNRMTRNPLRNLNCKEESCIAASVDAPQIVDHLCEPDRQHFVQVLEHLDEVEVAYELNPRLIRDKGMYNRTVVEFRTSNQEGRQIELVGGGRYDTVVEKLGGEPTPAFGLACGIERLVSIMKQKGLQAPLPPAPDVFLAQIGDEARRKSLKLFLQLRAESIFVAESLSKEGIKSQLENAVRSRARFALILGQKEIIDGTILLRDMENGIQEVIDFQKIVGEVKKRLERTQMNGTAPTLPPYGRIPGFPSANDTQQSNNA